MRNRDIHVGLAFPYHDADLAELRAISPRLHIRAIDGLGQEAVDEIATADLDVLIAQQLPSRIEAVPKLRWLQILSAGVDHVLARGDWPDRITLTNARGAYAGAMSQFALAAILRTAEPMAARQALQMAGTWPDDHEGLLSTRLRGRLVVLVGYGGIGREIGRLVEALGMRVIAAKARPEVRADDVFHLEGCGDPEGSIPERFVGMDSLARAAGEADYLVITLPMTQRTRGVVSAEVIDALPKRAWVINIGRGAVVDEGALIGALTDHRIAGAILDVYEREPLPAGSPLWHLPNVTLTPHIAGSGAEFEVHRLVKENLRRFVAGEVLLHKVDITRGY